MEINILTVIATLINFALIVAIILVIYKAIIGIKNYINKSKELDKKVDIILNKLNGKDN
ncbi:hypothetical protein [Clostridium omnivorum]|uniref:Carboxymuconolactone decarboxylase n=1 Tax=Clostridium omnivorum TaxID=1604902 RepID=A0ABQ5N535_9CLOT|nr:hypothetical protein [Clostridium sp. E14]GLC30160.1 hypothetical protein bsdE14_15700 [Clostridium sp. E14]